MIDPALLKTELIYCETGTTEMPGGQHAGTPANPTLGPFLKKARLDMQMSLREVEKATGKEVSNAYLSQLESGKITKPSPHVLYALSISLGVAYETLMERAGYIVPASSRVDGEKHGRAADELTRLRAELAAVTAERDALLARLAPVDDEALLEIAVREVEKVIASANDSETVGAARWKALRVAIAATRPHIEAVERERCAKVADKHEHVWHDELAHPCARAIAAAIRSGK